LVDIPEQKTRVLIKQKINQTDFEEGDFGYIDGYVRGGDERPYAVVVRLRDGYIDLAMVHQLQAVGC
jgi:hypothetical protein